MFSFVASEPLLFLWGERLSTSTYLRDDRYRNGLWAMLCVRARGREWRSANPSRLHQDLHQEIALGFAEYLFNALKTWVTKVCRDAPRKVNIFKERCILSTKPFMFWWISSHARKHFAKGLASIVLGHMVAGMRGGGHRQRRGAL